MPEYDYLIAGAGIAGLYTAYHLNKQFPSTKICILESSAYIGGRLHTIAYDGIKVDGGGARFNTEQYRILALVKELGLDNKKIPLPSSDAKYMPVYINSQGKYDLSLEQIFPTIDDFILDMQNYIHRENITKQELIDTSILEFANKYYSKSHPTIKEYLVARYPYYSELSTLNALEGINLFTNEFSKKMKYFILDGGLEQLASTIFTRLKQLPNNITIHTETPLESIVKTITKSDTKYTITGNGKIFIASKIILALPKPALSKIKYLTQNKDVARMINSIQNEPLYRIYARYPIDKETGKVWFDGLPKIVTNLPIKYIIPNNYKKGVIMISYTDSKFAKYWFKQIANGVFETTLNKQLKLLFPDKNIPKPKWYKHCPWIMGAGYWKKGSNREEILPKMIQPLADGEELYICGENYSSHQAWVEGSLETADMVLAKLGVVMQYTKQSRKQSTKQSTKKHSKKHTNIKVQKGGKKDSKKQKTYTLEDVAKHNKKTDAWIVIDGKVADITEWIPKHPGGEIIMKGVGKDATKLFNSIGHDEYAKKMFKKYQIGVVGTL